MKARGIWIAIGLILVVGIASTIYTRQYISSASRTAPAGTAMKSAGPEEAEEETVPAAVLRLQELDQEIEKNHSRETEGITANSRKAAADSERKLWEKELERILDVLDKKLDGQEKEKLFSCQKEWIRTRESIAVDASKKQIGSTLEELEYNVSMAETTRARAYELSQIYADLLEGEAGN